MNVQELSGQYRVRRLHAGDVEKILALSASNPLFYRYHPPFVTRESILADQTALPPGKTAEDKDYVGFFDQDDLVAVLDVILGYPQEKTAFIGLLMVDAKYQGKGVGSRIISECAACLKQWGFRSIRLAIDEGNPQSKAFWIKNRFALTGEAFPNENGVYLPMERRL